MGRALERDEAKIQEWKAKRWVEIKKAQKERRTIVFVDESGLSERPHRTRTWAPKGQTPVLQYHFTWKTLSVIVGITFWNFYFRPFPGTIRSPQILEFLTHLLRHIHLSGPLPLPLRSHRQRQRVRRFHVTRAPTRT